MRSEMSQDLPNTAIRSEPVAAPEGNADQPGMPLTRSEKAAMRPSRATRPVRWPRPSASRTAESTRAPALAPMTSPRAAPPAGSLAARGSITVRRLPQTRLHETCSVSCVNELTVEQLAYETGMSVRNIRNHQSRGLLPPPDVRSRVGYYGEQHVARLRLIQELQADG